MTTYTPNQSVTVIDAKDVRGPGRIHRRTPRIVFVEFEHHTASGREWDAGAHWGISDLPDRGLQILPEPFTGPKGEEEMAPVNIFMEAPVDQGESNKPLTAPELDKIAAHNRLAPGGVYSSVRVDIIERLLSMARSSLAGEVPAGMKLVPVEPTAAMGNAMWRAISDQGFQAEDIEVHPIYAAALSSAPDALSEGEVNLTPGQRENIEWFDAWLTARLETDAPDAEALTGVNDILRDLLRTTPPTGPGQELLEAATDLSGYAGHDNDCDANMGEPCDCGYSDASSAELDRGDKARAALSQREG